MRSIYLLSVGTGPFLTPLSIVIRSHNQLSFIIAVIYFFEGYYNIVRGVSNVQKQLIHCEADKLLVIYLEIFGL